MSVRWLQNTTNITSSTDHVQFHLTQYLLGTCYSRRNTKNCFCKLSCISARCFGFGRSEDFKKILFHSTLQKCYFPFLNLSFIQRRLRSFQLGMCRVSWNSVFAKVFLFVGGNKCWLEKLQSKT